MKLSSLALALLVPTATAQGPLTADGSPVARTEPAPSTAQTDGERPWTLMVYGAADNNADGPILHFLDDVRRALDDDPGIELLLFIDRSEGFSNDSRSLGADFAGARVFRLGRDSAELLDADEYFPGMSEDPDYEVDSADPENVARFVAFGKEHFPAERYGLMIYSHADGCTMCPDEESGRSMSIPELTDWVDERASVDFLALELCNMGGVEIGYQWRPGNGGFGADVLVAIPNAGPPLDWDRAFARIRTPGHAPYTSSRMGELGETIDPAEMSAADFGRLVVEEGHRGRRRMAELHPQDAEHIAHEAAGCYDLRQVERVKQAIDRLAVELARDTSGETKELFESLRGPGEAGTVMNYVRDSFGERPYVDLYDLLRRAAMCEELADSIRAAALEALGAVDRLVLASFGMPGLEGFEPGKNGIFLVFPDGDARTGFMNARVWRSLAWYTPLEPAEEGGPYGRWAFLADGATPDNGEVENWFELLDFWFDDTSEDPGGLNGYVP